MSATTISQADPTPDLYQPGVCNIGPAEIRRRRTVGHVGLVATVLVFAALVVTGAPHLSRLILFATAGAAASGYLQAHFHFCAGFGSRGLYNFGELGDGREVEGAEDRARDRRRSTQIGLASAAVGVAVAVVAILLPF